MNKQDIVLLWIHGVAFGAFIMNFYWGKRIRRIEAEQKAIRKAALAKVGP